MMKEISSQKLAEILNCGKTSADVVINKVSTDSRLIDEHSLFIALRGERFDAHDFVADVVAKGCPLVVVDHLIKDVPAEKQLVVNDTLEAYGKIGAYNRSQFKGTVIGLTGSAGKTTTKEEIAFFLPYLLQEIQIIQPEILVTLGNTALRAVLGDRKASIGDFHGKLTFLENGQKLLVN